MVPDLGDFANVEIIDVLVRTGDDVVAEQGLVTLETEKAIMAAARLLDVPEKSLDIRDGIVIETGKNLSISLREIADSLAGAPGYKMPAGMAPGLESAINFETSALTYGIGAHACEVEVDALTGGVTLLNYVAVNDCGRIINPDGVINQAEGGIVQAISWTLKEQVRFDRTRITSRDWETYPILDMTEAPETIDCVLINMPNIAPSGAGEGTMRPLAAAVANAIYDATGVRLRTAPFTPERLKAAWV